MLLIFLRVLIFLHVDFPMRVKFVYFVDFPTRVDFPTGRKNFSYLSNLSGLIRSNIHGWVDFFEYLSYWD